MAFITDKQTTEELSLLNRYQPGSVFSLFNKTVTRGGTRLLEHMLQRPMTDAEKINSRSAIFRWFQQKAVAFPLRAEEADAFVDWWDGPAAKTPVGGMLSLLKKKTLAIAVRDERYQRHAEGLKAAAAILRKLDEFVRALAEKGEEHPYRDKIDRLQTLLADRRLEKFRSAQFSFRGMAYYTHLLRNTLQKQVEEVIQIIEELDVYIAVSGVARARGFSYADALALVYGVENVLYIDKLVHPALTGAVGNDLRLDIRRNLLFLTGANMAGKSTLMKAVGIAIYLAHAGFPVAAAAMTFSVKDGLFTSINVPDNIHLGYSHFYAEVLRVKQAAELVAQKRNVMVMFDELFKGTNVKDAYEGTLEVTRAFAGHSDCLFIISTHIIEVGEALKGMDNIRFGYMPTELIDGAPQYPYTIREGITEDRQGMMIIRGEGVLELLRG